MAVNQLQFSRIDPLKEFNGWIKKYSKQYGKGYLTKGDHVIHQILEDGNKITLTVLDPQAALSIVPEALLPVSGYKNILNKKSAKP